MRMRTIVECINDIKRLYPHYMDEGFVKRLNEILEIHKAEKRTKGEWIRGKYTDDNIRYNDSSYKCSVCRNISGHSNNFCSWCGANMKEDVF